MLDEQLAPLALGRNGYGVDDLRAKFLVGVVVPDLLEVVCKHIAPRERGVPFVPLQPTAARISICTMATLMQNQEAT